MSKLFSRVSWPILVGMIVLGIAALFVGCQYGLKKYSSTSAMPDLIAGTVFPQPRAIIPFSLVDNQGHPFTNANLKNHWTFMFFGFTNCSHICPTTMTELSKIYQILDRKNIQEPQFVMITIDPERDNVQTMNTFVTAFNKNFIGLTGTQGQIDNLARALNVVVMKIQPQSDAANQDTIDHSGTIMLVNPRGNLVAVFTMPHSAKKIVKDYIKITETLS